jgi:hypothetical protein
LIYARPPRPPRGETPENAIELKTKKIDKKRKTDIVTFVDFWCEILRHGLAAIIFKWRFWTPLTEKRPKKYLQTNSQKKKIDRWVPRGLWVGRGFSK